ncbi:MAG: hypothetical protein HAW59_03935 [Betaproteobacteria bacterium]|nr:hypothetical protein [Betaproteobacteria bacterium]
MKTKLIFAVFLAAAAVTAAAQKIDVRGDSAEYSADGKRAEFSGNVVMKTGGVEVRAERLAVTVRDSGNTYRASGAPGKVSCPGCAVRAFCADCANFPLHLWAAEIVLHSEDGSLHAAGGVSVCAGAADECGRGRLSAESVIWRRQAAEVELRGAPAEGMWNSEDGGIPVTVRAETIAYFGESGLVELRGDASVSRGGEEIRGDAVKINVKTGEIAAGGDDGRVRGVFGVDE